MAPRTSGATFDTPDGKTFRPSTFVTLTLPSYGRVRPTGHPVDPTPTTTAAPPGTPSTSPTLVDRFWQNLRRAAGCDVQYFAAVEPQKRLAPHLHAAIRGTIPAPLIRQVVAATYHQVWWPPHDRPSLPARPPARSGTTAPAATSTRDTGQPLPTWDEALDADRRRPGRQPGARDPVRRRRSTSKASSPAPRRAGGCLRYLAKYLTKAVAECHDPTPAPPSSTSTGSTEELRWTPCSPRCANWLLYGVQPEGAPRRARPRPLPGQGPPPRHPRLRRPPRPRLPQVDRQDPRRLPRRPPRPRHARPGRHRHPRRPRHRRRPRPTRYSWALVGPRRPRPARPHRAAAPRDPPAPTMARAVRPRPFGN